MLDEGTRGEEDRAYLVRRARAELANLRLARLTALTLKAIEDLDREVERDVDHGCQAADIDAAIAAVTPLLGQALAAALGSSSGDPAELLSLRGAAKMCGFEARVLARLVRAGTSPVPFTRAGRHPRFRRGDVQKFLGAQESALPNDRTVALLAEAIKLALPGAQNGGRPLLRTEEAAERLGLRPTQLWALAARGRSPVQVMKVGRKFFFKRRDVEDAAARMRTAAPTPEPEER